MKIHTRITKGFHVKYCHGKGVLRIYVIENNLVLNTKTFYLTINVFILFNYIN